MVLGKVTAFDRLNEIANSKNEHEQCNGVRGGEKKYERLSAVAASRRFALDDCCFV